MKPAIDFIVDGKLFAYRSWDLIPRVGDTVILNEGKTWVEVTKVVWSDDSASPIDRQWVQIVCKKIPTQT